MKGKKDGAMRARNNHQRERERERERERRGRAGLMGDDIPM